MTGQGPYLSHWEKEDLRERKGWYRLHLCQQMGSWFVRWWKQFLPQQKNAVFFIFLASMMTMLEIQMALPPPPPFPPLAFTGKSFTCHSEKKYLHCIQWDIISTRFADHKLFLWIPIRIPPASSFYGSGYGFYLQVITDPDTDPTCQVTADPDMDLTSQVIADPDPTFHFVSDPDPNPFHTYLITDPFRIHQYLLKFFVCLKKKICFYGWNVQKKAH